MSDNNTLAQRGAQALGWNWAGGAARALVQFAAQVVLARLLGPEAFGQAAAVLLVVGVGWLVAEAGMGAALIQQAQLSDEDVGFALGRVLLMSMVVAAVVLLLAAPIATLLGDTQAAPFVRAGALLIPLQALSNLPLSLMQRRFQAKRLQAIQVLSYLLAYGGVGVWMAWQGFGAWALLAAFAVQALFTLVACWLAVRHSLRPRWRGHRSLRDYGVTTLLANLVNWALESLDRVLVGRGWGTVALGEYALAASLARAPVTLLVGSLQPVAFASASRLQDEPERLARGYGAMLALGLVLTLPCFVFLAWHAQAVVGLLYGPQWQRAAAPFAWLCLGVPFFVMLALTGPVLRGMGAVAGETRAQLWVLGVLCALLWCVMGQAMAWAAAAVSAATALRALLMYRALRARVAMPVGTVWRAWHGGGVLALVVSGVTASVKVAASFTGLGPLPCALASAALGSLGCVFLLHWRARRLLGAELSQALLNRQGDSRAAAWLCHHLRLH